MKITHLWKLLPVILFVTLLSGCASVARISEQGIVSASPSLGVRLRVVPADATAASQPLQTHFLHVVEVKEGQSAEAAGVLIGDILLELNGQTVTGMADSVAILQSTDWGDIVYASVLRGQQILKIPVLLDRKPVAKKSQSTSLNPTAAGIASSGESARASAAPDTPISMAGSMAPGTVQWREEKATAETGSSLEVATAQQPVPMRPVAVGRVATVKVSQAIVRGHSSVRGELIVSLRHGEQVRITEESDDWYGVITQDGRNITGYIHQSLLAF